MASEQDMLRQDFRTAMQRLAASVCVLTGSRDGEQRGLTATAVCSLTAEPPAVLVCINRSGGAHDTILASGAIGVNLLSITQQSLAARFAGMTGVPPAERFDEGDWFQGTNGAPLLRGALAALDCRIEHSTAFHTHTVLFCHVEHAYLGEDSGPLLYGGRAFRTLGDSVATAPDNLAIHYDFDAYAGLPPAWG